VLNLLAAGASFGASLAVLSLLGRGRLGDPQDAGGCVSRCSACFLVFRPNQDSSNKQVRYTFDASVLNFNCSFFFLLFFIPAQDIRADIEKEKKINAIKRHYSTEKL